MICLHGKRVAALWDSGSRLSLIAASFVQKVLASKAQLTYHGGLVTGITGVPEKPTGVYRGKIEVAGRKCDVEFLVMPGMPLDVLLGREVMKSLGVKLDFADPFGVGVTVGDTRVPTLAMWDRGLASVTVAHAFLAPLEDRVSAEEIKALQFPHLTSDQAAKVTTLLLELDGMFIKEEAQPTPADAEPGRIVTVGDPVIVPARRRDADSQATISRLRGEMQASGMVERSDGSPWRAEPHLVRKPNGDWRLVIDYRALNARTVRDAWPMPRVDVEVAKLARSDGKSESDWLACSLDISNAFGHIPIAMEDREKTTFRDGRQCWRFAAFPNGVTNGPPIFNHRIYTDVLEYLPEWMRERVALFVDDFAMAGSSFDDLFPVLEALLRRLYEKGYKMKLKKLTFFDRSIEFAGYRVESGMATPLQRKVGGVLGMREPRVKSEMQSFLGSVQQFKEFIPGLQRKLDVLYPYVRKKVQYRLDEVGVAAFDSVKEMVAGMKPLRIFKPHMQCVLEVDASGAGVGAVLRQSGQICAYYSRSYTKKEIALTRNNAMLREWLAIGLALDHWRYMILPSKVVVKTDSKNLTKLESVVVEPDMTELYELKMRLISRIAPFDLEIGWIPGEENVLADGLSRIPAEDNLEGESREGEFFPELSLFVVGRRGMVEDQRRDSYWGPIMAYLEEGTLSGDPVEARKVVALASNCEIIEGVLHHVWIPSAGPRFQSVVQIAVPASRVQRLLEVAHVEGGHEGPMKMMDSIRRKAWWPTLRKDCENHCKVCVECQRFAVPVRKDGFLRDTRGREGGKTRVSLDLAGPYRESQGFTSVLIMVNHRTLWCEIVPLKSTTQRDLIPAIRDNWICRYGVPDEFFSDWGTNLTGREIRDWMKSIGASWDNSTPRHHEANGVVEAYVKKFKRALEKLCEDHPSNWVDKVGVVGMALRNSVRNYAGFSPFELTFGETMRTSLDALIPGYAGGVPLNPSGVVSATHRFLKAEGLKNLDRRNRQRKDVRYLRGDLVWLENATYKSLQSPRFIGPFRIDEVLGSGTTVRLAEWKVAGEPAFSLGRINRVVHVERVKPFHPGDPVRKSWGLNIKGAGRRLGGAPLSNVDLDIPLDLPQHLGNSADLDRDDDDSIPSGEALGLDDAEESGEDLEESGESVSEGSEESVEIEEVKGVGMSYKRGEGVKFLVKMSDGQEKYISEEECGENPIVREYREKNGL